MTQPHILEAVQAFVEKRKAVFKGNEGHFAGIHFSWWGARHARLEP
jgi:hypothetical protein